MLHPGIVLNVIYRSFDRIIRISTALLLPFKRFNLLFSKISVRPMIYFPQNRFGGNISSFSLTLWKYKLYKKKTTKKRKCTTLRCPNTAYRFTCAHLPYHTLDMHTLETIVFFLKKESCVCWRAALFLTIFFPASILYDQIRRKHMSPLFSYASL